MVLEEAASSGDPSPFTSDGSQQQQPPPASDADPYAGDRNPTVLPSRDSSYILAAPGVYVNTANLPKPFTMPLTPSPMTPEKQRKALQNTMQQMCQVGSEAVGRPIRQEEADALAFHFTKSVRMASFGPEVGFWGAAILAWRGSSKMRFPGWTPDPEKFKFDKLLIFRGGVAKLGWHIIRIMSYTIPSMFLGTAFFGTYAATVGAVGQLSDPRLKEVNEKMRERAKLKRGELQSKVDETPGQRASETYEMARQRQSIQRSQQEARGRRKEVDDMSPTGGSFGDEFIETGNSGESGLMSDSQTKVAQQQSQRLAEPAQRSSSRHYGDDNASPSARPDSSSKQSTSSAWDRLRQQAQSGQGSTASSRSGPARLEESSSIDSFAFSNADEEKQLARTEAQQQFDARVERERSGRDFDEGGGKGWRR